MQTEALTIKDMARILSISTKTCYKMVRNRQIPYVKIGSTYRIPRQAILELLNSSNKIGLHAEC